jgi:hypothetical protein
MTRIHRVDVHERCAQVVTVDEISRSEASEDVTEDTGGHYFISIKRIPFITPRT